MVTLELAEFESPIGRILLAARDGALCSLNFTAGFHRQRAFLARRFGGVELRKARNIAHAVAALRRYFDGELGAIDSLTVDPGGTDFQRRVWSELRRVPAGRTISYSELAARIGAPAAVRAVGAANGANPIGIVIPCHRVICADHSLGNYGGGVRRKRWLLQHEGACDLGGTLQ